MTEKLSIEVIKHSNKDIRIIARVNNKTVRQSSDDLFLSMLFLKSLIASADIFRPSLIEE